MEMDAADSVQGDGGRETTRTSDRDWLSDIGGLMDPVMNLFSFIAPRRARRSKNRAACCARCVVCRVS